MTFSFVDPAKGFLILAVPFPQYEAFLFHFRRITTENCQKSFTFISRGKTAIDAPRVPQQELGCFFRLVKLSIEPLKFWSVGRVTLINWMRRVIEPIKYGCILIEIHHAYRAAANRGADAWQIGFFPPFV